MLLKKAKKIDFLILTDDYKLEINSEQKNYIKETEANHKHQYKVDRRKNNSEDLKIKGQNIKKMSLPLKKIFWIELKGSEAKESWHKWRSYSMFGMW